MQTWRKSQFELEQTKKELGKIQKDIAAKMKAKVRFWYRGGFFVFAVS